MKDFKIFTDKFLPTIRIKQVTCLVLERFLQEKFPNLVRSNLATYSHIQTIKYYKMRQQKCDFICMPYSKGQPSTIIKYQLAADLP